MYHPPSMVPFHSVGEAVITTTTSVSAHESSHGQDSLDTDGLQGILAVRALMC
jgi:hypothetical protein